MSHLFSYIIKEQSLQIDHRRLQNFETSPRSKFSLSDILRGLVAKSLKTLKIPIKLILRQIIFPLFEKCTQFLFKEWTNRNEILSLNGLV